MDGRFKYYPLILTVVLNLCLWTNISASDKNKTKAESDCLNYVLIQGSSNVNQFQFVNYNPTVNPEEDKVQEKDAYQHIQIPIYKFSGPNNRMLNDFYKMLRASEFPVIRIILEPRELADFDETSGMTNFTTNISIAGNSRSYVIPCEIVFCENSGFVVKGDLELQLTDFEIDPPKKVFGTIRVDNEVFITFAFRFALKET